MPYCAPASRLATDSDFAAPAMLPWQPVPLQTRTSLPGVWPGGGCRGRSAARNFSCGRDGLGMHVVVCVCFLFFLFKRLHDLERADGTHPLAPADGVPDAGISRGQRFHSPSRRKLCSLSAQSVVGGPILAERLTGLICRAPRAPEEGGPAPACPPCISGRPRSRPSLRYGCSLPAPVYGTRYSFDPVAHS